MDRKNKIQIIKLLPVLGIVIFAILYLIIGRRIDIDTLLSYSPKNLILAALFMVMLYAAKSLTIFFPIIILEILGGIIFPTTIALIINIIGCSVTFSLPYVIGRFSGSDVSSYLIDSHPKMMIINSLQKQNEWFLSFFLRAISCLPGDIVSLYLGSQKVPYFIFLSGSLLGSLFTITTATIIGASILNPASSAFMISVSIRILIAFASFIIYYYYIKKRRVQKRACKTEKLS